MSFFVVFDTCTHPRYYGDVHEVLSLPDGAVIRYEYKRRLFTKSAAHEIETLAKNPPYLPVEALLMYGEKKQFSHGDAEPSTMLRQADSTLVPTRSARLVAVFVDKAAEAAEDVFYMHFQLRGFIEPSAPAIKDLVDALEAENALPFGDRDIQYNWISLLPASLNARIKQLTSDDQAAWTKVVEAFVKAPTQFKNDVFWRVQSLVEVNKGQIGKALSLKDRSTNERVHSARWHRDYPLREGKRYAVAIQTYSPDGHGVSVPAGATVAMTSRDDDEALLKLSAEPMNIVPNQVEYKRFLISTDNATDTRFTGVGLETQVPEHTSPYPPGSMCSLSFSIHKDFLRIALGAIFILAGVAIGAYTTGAKLGGWWSAGLAVAAALCGVIGLWLIKRLLQIVKN